MTEKKLQFQQDGSFYCNRRGGLVQTSSVTRIVCFGFTTALVGA